MSGRFKLNPNAVAFSPGDPAAPAPEAPAEQKQPLATGEPSPSVQPIEEKMSQLHVSSEPPLPSPSFASLEPSANSAAEAAEETPAPPSTPAPAAASTWTQQQPRQPTSETFKLEDDEEEDGPEDTSSAAAQSLAPGKKNLNIVFIGHVDAGKSTISGHLMYLMGTVDERAMERLEREAKAFNRESWKFAYVFDANEEERERGKTWEVGAGHFSTESRNFTILDAPGHKSFVQHMIGGASQADIGVLVISAKQGEFESGFEKGGQTREHVMLAKTAGVRHLIVAINKMDDCSWSKERYDMCMDKLTPFLRSVGFNPKTDVTFMPLAGLYGINLKNRVAPEVCPWYSGPSLMEFLDTVKPPERMYQAPVRFPIIDKFKDMGGTMVLGKLETGEIKVGSKLIMYPTGVPVEVYGIYVDAAEIPAAEPGDNVRLRLKGAEEEDCHVGFVLSSPNFQMPCVTKFEAQIMLLDLKNIVSAGYACMLHVHTAASECTITTLVARLDKKTKEPVEKKPKFLKPGDSALVRIEVPQTICVELFTSFDRFGRFMLRDEGKTIAIGVITKLPKGAGSSGSVQDGATGGAGGDD